MGGISPGGTDLLVLMFFMPILLLTASTVELDFPGKDEYPYHKILTHQIDFLCLRNVPQDHQLDMRDPQFPDSFKSPLSPYHMCKVLYVLSNTCVEYINITLKSYIVFTKLASRPIQSISRYVCLSVPFV